MQPKAKFCSKKKHVLHGNIRNGFSFFRSFEWFNIGWISIYLIWYEWAAANFKQNWKKKIASLIAKNNTPFNYEMTWWVTTHSQKCSPSPFSYDLPRKKKWRKMSVCRSNHVHRWQMIQSGGAQRNGEKAYRLWNCWQRRKWRSDHFGSVRFMLTTFKRECLKLIAYTRPSTHTRTPTPTHR